MGAGLYVAPAGDASGSIKSGALVAGVVHAAAHRPGREAGARAGHEQARQPVGRLVARVEPLGVRLGGTITGMRSCTCATDAAGEVVTMQQDSSGSPVAGSRQRSHSPAMPNGAPSANAMKYGCFTAPDALPLVVAVGQHQAAAAPERAAERRLLGQRLAARVDHARADRLLLRPGRHQAPVQHRELARPARLAHRRDELRRRDVVARLDLGRVGHAEQPRHGLMGGVEGEAAAHGLHLLPRADALLQQPHAGAEQRRRRHGHQRERERRG